MSKKFRTVIFILVAIFIDYSEKRLGDRNNYLRHIPTVYPTNIQFVNPDILSYEATCEE